MAEKAPWELFKQSELEGPWTQFADTASVEMPPPTPEGGFIPAVQRGFLQTGILMGDILPAMAARLVGANEYAERQFREAAETERKIAEKYAPAVASYKDIKDVGTAVTYLTESVGELVPSILPSLFTGGVAGVVGRGAVLAAKEAAEAAARKQIAEKGVEALTQKEVADQIRNAGIEAARRTAMKYDAVGIVAGSSLQNIPEVYKNIKDETEEESIGTALLFGGFNSLLDAALPLSILTKMRKAGIPEEQVIGEWYKRFGKGASKGFATEAATEVAQEMSSAAAEKFVDENLEFFSEKNLERFINAGLKGGLGGGVISGTTDVVLGKKSLTEDLKPLDEDIRNTQADILARRALLDELRAQAEVEGQNKLDTESLKNLGFQEKHSLYENLLNKDINDPAQAAEVVGTLESAIDDESIKGKERKAVNDALAVISEYLETRAEPDVAAPVQQPSGAGIQSVTPPVAPPVAEGVAGTQPVGVVPAVSDVGVPTGGEGVAAAPVTPPVETQAPAPVAPPAEPAPPTTQELITQQEAELSTQMEKFQNLLQEQVRRYGLKDVAVKVDADLKNANGQYSKGLIKMAVEAVDPVRDLRHESIHALKELGFFTPAQWDSLVRQAKTSWINTYMMNRDVNGNFIEEGQESRYEAYVRLFKQQGLNDAQIQESLIEEAIADAFGDFSTTKAPPGMLQAILRRMREFFQSIKEALGGAGVTDPERIFGKIEKAELAPAKVEAKPAAEEKPPVETAPAVPPTPVEAAKPEETPQKYVTQPTPQQEVQDAKIYEAQNGILPYTSEGQLDVPRAKYSIKREGKYANHPLFDIPLNKNGTVTLYYPTTNETARQVIRDRKLFGATPTSNRVYLTNESSGPKVMNNPGNIDQPMNGANILFQVDPDLLQLDMEHPDGRKDFFIPIAEGEAFAQKMAMSKLFTLNAPRAKALSKDTKLTDLERRITDGINQYLDLDPAAQRERLKQAKDLLKREHNVTTLLGENGKLEKTRIGDYGLTYEGKGVSSLGLGLASAQRINEQNLSTCPKSAICEGLCLGETSGQNLLYGGEGQFKSGPRLSQYLKTEAMVLHPEDFAIALHDEIKKFARNTKRDDMQPAIRLNVTSDFRPQTWGAIMGAFPDVMFYDYTKLPTKPAAPNHHLTYSSTGASQVVNGKTVINPETNWDKMVQQMLDGNNVAMAFTSRKSMPEFVIDERTGERFQVWNGDNYDARFLDPKPGEPGNLLRRGMIIGLTNKDKTTNPDQAAEKYKGFFVDYDPARDGKTLTIPNQKALTAGKTISIVRPEFKASLRSPDTREFKQFLEGSKAVDSDGKGLPYFHATLRDITAFKGGNPDAIFMSPDPEFSNAYFAQKLREAAQRPGEYLTQAEIRSAVRLLREYVYENYGRQSKMSKEMLETISEVESEGKKTGVYKFTGELGDAWAGNTDQMGAIERSMKTGRNIIPLYVNVQKPFDYENKDQVAKVLKQMMLDPSIKERYGFDPAPGGADLQAPENFMLRKTLERSEKDYAAAVRDRYREPILDGDWRTIESPEVQAAVRKLHDGFYVAEEGMYGDTVKNLAVYNPKQIKSATGNVGTFGQRPPTEEEAQKVGMTAEEGLEAQEAGDIRFSLRSQIDPSINARILQTTTEREEKGFVERITDAFKPGSGTFSKLRAAALNRYNRLGEYDKEKIRRMGGAELLADANAESAALLSDVAAGLVAGSLGVYDKVGGVPVYNRHFVVEKTIQSPTGSRIIQLGGKITSRTAAEALARRQGGVVRERGYTAVTNQNNTIKGPIAIFAPLAKMGDPYAYRAYQYWAGVKRGSKWVTNQNGQVVEQLFNDPNDIQKAEKLRQDFLSRGIDFEAIQKEWITYNDQLVQYMLDTGVISQRNADKFREHGDYLPFYRQINGDDDAVGPRIFQTISAVKAPKKIKGGQDPLGDFLENVVRNTQAAVQAGLKNVAARRAADVGMDLGRVTPITQAQAQSNPVSFYVLENGERVYYDSSDMLFVESIKSLGLPDFPGIGLLSAPADILRNLVTKDPGFMLANMMRDSLAAWTTSGVNMIPVAATLKNFTDALAGSSPEYRALLMAGVVGGYDYSQGTKDAAKQFGKELRKTAGTKTAGEKALTPFTSLWDGLEKGTQASDAATRIEVYKQTLKETGNEAEALFRALEVMNFNRKGNNPIVRIATAAIPFLNARMQGLDVLYRAGMGKNTTANAQEIQKAFWVRGMTMAALSTMYWALTHDDEEYKRQEQETRDNNWLFPSLGIRIPIPFEVGVLFKVIPERIAALTLGDDTAKDFTSSMTRQLVSTLAVNPIPQTILPLVEAATNYSFFTDRPIVAQGIEGVASAYEVGPGTSRMAEALGKSLNMSPMKIDQIIKGYTGTIGQYMSDVIDAVYDMHTDNPKASKRFEQLPVIKRFALDPDARGQVTAYYDLKNSVDEAVRTASHLERSMNWEEWGKYYSDNVQMFAFKDYILDLEKTMKEYRDMKNMIRALPMSADQKRDSVLAITQLENQLNSNIQIIKKQMQK